MLTKAILFHQDTATAHRSVVAMSIVHDCEFELIDYPLYHPNLALSDYFLFLNIKNI